MCLAESIQASVSYFLPAREQLFVLPPSEANVGAACAVIEEGHYDTFSKAVSLWNFNPTFDCFVHIAKIP